MKRFLPYLLCASILLSLNGSALAYILPAEQILTFMIKALGPARSFEILQRATEYDSAFEGGVHELNGVLYYRHPDRFRSEVSAPGGEQIRVVSPEGAISVADGKIISETEAPLDHFKDLLFYRDTEALLKRLSEFHIDLDIVSLGRFKDKIAYVIGAKYPDESVPQVWIEKDTFRPIRYVVRGRGPNNMDVEEVEYADYTPLDKKRWYPGRILFFRNGQLARVYVLSTFRLNPDLPDAWFDVAYLKTLYEPIASSGPSPSPPSALDEVKKTITDFSKAFE